MHGGEKSYRAREVLTCGSLLEAARGGQGRSAPAVKTSHARYKSLAAALSRAGMLAELARAGVEFRRPVTDLGCGDGLFARALREIGLLDGVDVALDYRLASMGALALRPRLGAARGDLTALPFRSG